MSKLSKSICLKISHISVQDMYIFILMLNAFNQKKYIQLNREISHKKDT